MSSRTGDMLAAAMGEAARRVLAFCGQAQRDAATHDFDDPARTRWTYLPGPRPGVPLLGLGAGARKAVHRLVATALSRHAFAQVTAVMAMEEVLDLDEGYRRGRHSDDYRLAVFGTPGDEAWAWRFEGHHLSVSATVIGGQVSVAPLFFGVNPARVTYRGRTVIGPLAVEEDLGRALVQGLPRGLREKAIVAERAPADIRTGDSSRVDIGIEPHGVSGADLDSGGRDLLDLLLRLYLDRLHPEIAARYEPADLREVSIAWEGGIEPGEGHYYRVQTPALLVEYDNTAQNANHAHTVLRLPGADFGAGLLPAHHLAERG